MFLRSNTHFCQGWPSTKLYSTLGAFQELPTASHCLPLHRETSEDDRERGACSLKALRKSYINMLTTCCRYKIKATICNIFTIQKKKKKKLL